MPLYNQKWKKKMKYKGFEIKKGKEYYVSETSIIGSLNSVKKMIDKRVFGMKKAKKSKIIDVKGFNEVLKNEN